VEKKKFIITAIVIIVSITMTVAFQVYWNIKNYQENKRQLISELQSVLDQSIDEYFNTTADRNIELLKQDRGVRNILPDSIVNGNILVSDSKRFRENNKGLVFITETTDSVYQSSNGSFVKQIRISDSDIDSVDLTEIRNMASRIIVTISEDKIDIDRLDSIFTRQLEKRSIPLSYTITQEEKNAHWFEERNQSSKHDKIIKASSSFLTGGSIEVKYEDLTYNTLKRSFAGISISVLITLFIAISLLYLYQTIKDQKELALIKNDLINNITHELKTPIATAMTAMEGIRNFNKTKDPAKTEKYLDVSSMQLNKLSEMVEKLLETATLDNNALTLKKERIDVASLFEKLKSRFGLVSDKKIEFQIDDDVFMEIDAFHFENAIANLIDNAIKYGGDKIIVSATQESGLCKMKVVDNGGNIDANQAKKVFDKFYRVSTGNVHDVKGFGIGLYYTKKVVEQHEGEINLETGNSNTTFKIQV